MHRARPGRARPDSAARPRRRRPLPRWRGSPVFLYPNQQHFVNGDSAGNIRRHWWDGSTHSITTDTWGTRPPGQPGGVHPMAPLSTCSRARHEQLAGGTGSEIRSTEAGATTGAHSNAGLTSDPAAIVIGDYEDVWARRPARKLQHLVRGGRARMASSTYVGLRRGRPAERVRHQRQAARLRAAGGGGTALEHWW